MINIKLLSISIIIAGIILSIPLWRISIALTPPPVQKIDLPDANSIKEQITGNDAACKFLGYKYSIDKTKLMVNLSFTEGDRFFPNCTVMYKMDEFGRFIRTSNISNVKRNFPVEIK